MVKCNKISIDCIPNNLDDINIGGPEILGFDFYVREENAKKMMIFIAEVLTILNIPFMRIYISEKLNLNENQVFSKERIVEIIKNEASFIKNEAMKTSKSKKLSK